MLTDAPPPAAPPPAGPPASGPPPGQFGPPPAGPPAGPPPGGPPPGQFGPPPPGPPPGRRGSILLGIGIGIGAFLLVWALSVIPGGTDYYMVPVLLWLGMPPVLLIVGIVLAIIPRTSRTGAGILISVGAGVLIIGGVCIALISGI